MTNFTTRVELHDAKTWQDYDNLHKNMAAEGFSRSITQNGVSYELPTAEYAITSNLTILQITTKAKSAANKTGKSSSVLTSQTVLWHWDNLKATRQAA